MPVSASNPDTTVLIAFDFSVLPSDANITGAVLQLYIAQLGSGNLLLEVSTPSHSWTASYSGTTSTLVGQYPLSGDPTWYNYASGTASSNWTVPGAAVTPAMTQVFDGGSNAVGDTFAQSISITNTTLLQSWMTASNNYGFALSGKSTSGGYIIFGSPTGNAAYKPALVVSYTSASAAPSSAPSGPVTPLSYVNPYGGNGYPYYGYGYRTPVNGAVVGGIIGGVMGLMIIITLVSFFIRRS